MRTVVDELINNELVLSTPLRLSFFDDLSPHQAYR
jgi:hypothetical protein